MNIINIFDHLGYVVCFWIVWKALEGFWKFCLVLGRTWMWDPDPRPVVDHQILLDQISGLSERLGIVARQLDKATAGLKFDADLIKEVEKLRKKIHELAKATGEPPPCALPVNPESLPPQPMPKKRATRQPKSIDKTPSTLKEVLAKAGKPSAPRPRHADPHKHILNQLKIEEVALNRNSMILKGKPSKPEKL